MSPEICRYRIAAEMTALLDVDSDLVCQELESQRMFCKPESWFLDFVV